MIASIVRSSIFLVIGLMLASYEETGSRKIAVL